MSSDKKAKEFKKPTFGLALCALMSVVISLIVCIMVFKTVSIQTGLLLGIFFVTLISKTLGYTFNDLMKFISHSIGESTFGLWFFFAIGAIVASWMAAGTVPAIIYYGLGIISPKVFLPAGLLLCSVTALCTGTSWGTIGTVGIALVGIGQGLGIPLPITAAMVVSGAAFGDKMSPVSDTPNLTSMTSGADLYESIKAMIQTMWPAYVVSLVAFTFLGFKYGGGQGNLAIIEETRNVLEANFNLHPIVILPIVILLILNIKKFPSLPAMTVAVISGLLVAIVFQGMSIPTALETINSGFSIETGSSYVDPILNRGGIQKMLWTFSVAFMALSLGGILNKVGYMDALISGLIKRAKTVGSLSLIVMLSSMLSTAAFGEAYLSFILNGNLFKKEFDKRGLNRAMLARLISEGGLMMTPLMPWTTFGAFVATTLGASGFEFAPYAFLNYLSPVVSVAMSYLGIAVVWNNKNNKGVRNFSDVDLSDEPELAQ
ncbi:MAG: Na+/H+ antiporter NhaC [Anaeromicrobium sp.]|jgi:NhaC family Na+:H+ antiporter|uniref:Na+/H+ antiporter NhaC n=1 Tax=Anaeromicrobium sp. TaxID=1929132 RepID=UPI0025D88567|nr:Na+/H+ antiporter NhaC [Anaeromicrobium sp.]MCT4593419.1 Na+/H+ antiporter NhaC [Anaeromicrobium sp.]